MVRKRKTTRGMSYDQMRKRGRIFGGKKYKYLVFIPDAQHQGKPGYIDVVRKSLRSDGASVRTVRTPTGWKVYARGSWFKGF